jgi:glycerophosphoryl diester phosphodiesterase
MRSFLFLSAVLFISSSLWALDIEGHRGARAIFPENTLKAFAYALDVGVTTLEMDMQVTKDDKIVISHEAFLTPERCLDSAGHALRESTAIRSLTLKQVQSYDCGSLPNPRFPVAQQLPTLEPVFVMVEQSQLANAKTVQFNIETKIVPGHPELSPSPEKFVDLFLPIVRAHHLLSRTILESFDHRTLVIAKRKEPGLRIAALIAENLPNLVLLAKDLKVEIISPDFEWIDAQVVSDLHRAGVQVIPWTVNEAKDWKALLAMKVDGIITDDPLSLKNYLLSHP